MEVFTRPVAEFINKLQCPDCAQGTLALDETCLSCTHCRAQFPIIEALPFLFPTAQLAEWQARDQRVRRTKATEAGSSYHWQTYQIESFLPAENHGREVLLLGCGDGEERPLLQQLGYQTLAFDVIRSRGTDFLADAHRLPLQDASVDMVLTMQVFEHLHAPWLAAAEIARVLRPGGWLIGSVAFLKPYHHSYFHITHQGVALLLAKNGIVVDKVAGAQNLTYSLYGNLIPLGNRQISRKVYGAFDRLLYRLRCWLWARKTGLDPQQPTDRFDASLSLSFAEYEKIRFAPAVVFRGQKRHE